MNKNLKKNYIFNLAYQVLVLSVPLITTPYLSRVLGADKIGEYSFAQSIVSYFVLVAVLGTSLYGQRTIAYEKAKNGDIGKAFLEIVIIRCLGVFVFTIIYLGTIVTNMGNHELYLISGIELVATAFDISWFYQGIEEFQNITILNGASKILGTILIFGFVKNSSDLILYVGFYCSAILLGNILQWAILHRYLNFRVTRALNLSQHIKLSVRLFVSQLAIQLYTVLDKTMIGIITKSNYENGYYEQSQKLVKMATTLVTAIGTVMASRIAILYGVGYNKNKKEIQQLLESSFRLVFCMAMPITFGIILVASRFVPMFYGAGYEKVIPMISLLSVIVPAIGTSNIIGIQLFVPSKREKLLTESVVVGSCINVILNLLLITRYGAIGAIVASIVAEYSVTLVQIYLARKEIPCLSIARLFARYLIMSAVMFVCGITVSQYVPKNLVGIIIIVVASIVVYGLELVLSRDPIIKQGFKS